LYSPVFLSFLSPPSFTSFFLSFGYFFLSCYFSYPCRGRPNSRWQWHTCRGRPNSRWQWHTVPSATDLRNLLLSTNTFHRSINSSPVSPRCSVSGWGPKCIDHLGWSCHTPTNYIQGHFHIENWQGHHP
jgi:hypothetical protein